jgi:hypothetical protein
MHLTLVSGQNECRCNSLTGEVDSSKEKRKRHKKEKAKDKAKEKDKDRPKEREKEREKPRDREKGDRDLDKVQPTWQEDDLRKRGGGVSLPDIQLWGNQD